MIVLKTKFLKSVNIYETLWRPFIIINKHLPVENLNKIYSVGCSKIYKF